MPWVKIDDQLYDHPKVAKLRPDLMLACIGLETLALCWCNNKLTDGIIPSNQVFRLAGDQSQTSHKTAQALVDELIRVVLWEKISEDSYYLHDYLDFQPSKDQWIAEQKQKSSAGKKGAQSRWNPGSKIAPVITHAIAPAITGAMAPPMAESCPVPVPDPVSRSPITPLNPPSGDSSPKGRKRKPRATFEIPTVEECESYAVEIGLPINEGTTFFDYWKSVEWVSKRSGPVKDWRARMRTWKHNYEERHPPVTNTCSNGSRQTVLDEAKRMLRTGEKTW
jgi:hypothetical protein